jgi:hypothetical protein
MMNIIARLILLVSIVLLSFGCRGDGYNVGSVFGNKPEPEEYAVYSGLLDSSIDGIERDKHGIIVLNGTTVPINVVNGRDKGGFYSITRIGSYIRSFDEKLSIFEIGWDTLADFEKKNWYPTTLAYQFDIRAKYLLCSDEEHLELKQSPDYWSRFYTCYPDSFGMVGFSRVGFDRKRIKAIVYREWLAGPLAGAGHLVFLSKVGGEWVVKRRITLWIS